MSRCSLRLPADRIPCNDEEMFNTRPNERRRWQRVSVFSESTLYSSRPSTSLSAYELAQINIFKDEANEASSFLDDSIIQKRNHVGSYCDEGNQSTDNEKPQTSSAPNYYSHRDHSFRSTWRDSYNGSTSPILATNTGRQSSYISSPRKTVYSRDNQTQKPGVFRMMSKMFINSCRKITSFVLDIFIILMQCFMLKGLLLSMWRCCVWLWKKFTGFTSAVMRKVLWWRKDPGICAHCGETRKEYYEISTTDIRTVRKRGNERYYIMNGREVIVKDPPKFNGVLCDDCKRKNTQPFQDKEPVADLWSLLVLTGQAASASVLRLVSLFTQFLPMLSNLLFLVPFLLFLAFWYWGPSGLLAILPLAKHNTPPPTKTVTPKEGPAETHSQRASIVMSSVDMERFTRLEESIAQLWDRVAGGLLRQEEQHTEVLSLYNTLRIEFHRHTDKESMAKWIGDMLEERFSYLKREVEKQGKHTQQNYEKHAKDVQLENSRLAEAEALLQTLARRIEDLQRKQEQAQRSKVPVAATTDPDSNETDNVSNDLVLEEVKRLDDELDRIRVDVHGLKGCKDRCDKLDVYMSSVSEQVEKEVRSLFYGSEKADELDLPESLMQWLSDQFVSTNELQVSLRALERSILGNLSLQIEENQSPSKETITKTIIQATGDAGLTEDDVQLIVDNALKLYSQDRIGMVDYALESGGGTIISTRCTVAFNSRTALMSLFGIPLWYFSQSPRVVIQPDVHPGNCWAFEGSGYLVIGLARKIVPTAFTLEHVPKSLSPTRNISSAPKEFSVYGLDNEYDEEGQLFGQFTYEEDGDALQTFSVTEEVTGGFQVVEVRVLSNWGHPDYTCMYRFRVHGEIADDGEISDDGEIGDDGEIADENDSE